MIDLNKKKEDLSVLEALNNKLREILDKEIGDIEEDDLEFGISKNVPLDKNIKELWEKGIEKNNYYEVSLIETLEHHDGVYVKITFKNEAHGIKAHRYASVRASGKTELSHRAFIEMENLEIILELLNENLKLTVRYLNS